MVVKVIPRIFLTQMLSLFLTTQPPNHPTYHQYHNCKHKHQLRSEMHDVKQRLEHERMGSSSSVAEQQQPRVVKAAPSGLGPDFYAPPSGSGSGGGGRRSPRPRSSQEDHLDTTKSSMTMMGGATTVQPTTARNRTLIGGQQQHQQQQQQQQTLPYSDRTLQPGTIGARPRSGNKPNDEAAITMAALQDQLPPARYK
jgi:hypothetical protein